MAFGMADILKYSPVGGLSIDPLFMFQGAMVLIVIASALVFGWRFIRKKQHNILLPILDLSAGGYNDYLDWGKLYWEKDLVKFHIYSTDVTTVPMSFKHLHVDKRTGIKWLPLFRVATGDYRPIEYEPKGNYAAFMAKFKRLGEDKQANNERMFALPLELDPADAVKVKVIDEGAKFAYVQRVEYHNTRYAKPMSILEKYKLEIGLIVVGGIFLLGMMFMLKSFEKIGSDVVGSFSSISAQNEKMTDLMYRASQNMNALALQLGVVGSNVSVTPPIG